MLRCVQSNLFTLTFLEAMGAGATFFLGAYSANVSNQGPRSHSCCWLFTAFRSQTPARLLLPHAHHLDGPWIQPLAGKDRA